jgi:DNA polymerase I-like protein with 3'-5' exonuclease and polymerase domains
MPTFARSGHTGLGSPAHLKPATGATLGDYRCVFHAGENRKLVIADYSQIEMRVLADFARMKHFCEPSIQADLHRATASHTCLASAQKGLGQRAMAED